MKTTLKTQIEEFLKSLNIDNLEIMDYVDIEEIDMNNAFDSIYGQIDNAGGFNVEIIYYSNAIQYLSENDKSLMDSIGIALENGFTLENINSELLASLLATQKVSEDFYDKETDIDEFFNNLNK
jgi:hypothetical protein